MKLFDRLLGKTPKAPNKADLPATIKAFDAYGRPIEVLREEWRTKVLPGHFEKYWNDPDGLAAAVTQALNDGFYAEALEPARQLDTIDKLPERGAVLLAVTLLQLQRPRDAKKVLDGHLKRHAETGIVVTNLAKAESALGHEEEAGRLLARAIELDPNQDNGLLWYAAREKERAGAEGWTAALRRAATMPRAWRPQLWLAREALEGKDAAAARALYAQAFASNPAPDAEMLMQISGDLGNNGQLDAIIDIVAPRFDPERHGLNVGNNLIKAHLELGRAADARAVLEQLYRLQRPDWQQHLTWWETQIDNAQNHYGPIPEGDAPRISLMLLDTPIWASEALRLKSLVPAKPDTAPKVLFFCGSGEKTTTETRITSQPADMLGRFTRALPLHLAEACWHRTDASTSTVIPWFERGGFVLAAREWSPEHLPDFKGEGHVVFLHIDARARPWRVRVRLVQREDGHLAGEAGVDLDESAPAAGVLALEEALFELLRGAGIPARAEASQWAIPRDVWLPAFLVNTEQLLALRVASNGRAPEEFLHSPRSIIDALVQNCASQPASARWRLLLFAAMACELRRRPDIAREYRTRLIELQRQHAIAGPLGAALAQAHTTLIDALAAGAFPAH